MGTRGNAEIRLKEAEAAAKIMGVDVRINLGLKDCFFQQTEDELMQIIEIIRLFQPTIILGNSPKDRHPDHAKAAKLVSDAAYYSGLLKIKTKWEGEEQEEWRPKVVYHYMQDYYIDPDFVMDISPYIDDKFQAILAYKSQFYDPESTEKDTPISSIHFIENLKGKASFMGRQAGFTHAEGFVVNRTIGVKNLFDLI